MYVRYFLIATRCGSKTTPILIKTGIQNVSENTKIGKNQLSYNN